MALPRILLVGGGHAQLAVLADWIRHGRPECDATLINPAHYLRYSGMIPGIISGDYHDDEGLIDLPALASAAGVAFIEQKVVSLDADERQVRLDDGSTLVFDLCSIDTGGVGRAETVLGSDPRLLDIRPIDRFVAQWRARIAGSPTASTRIAVIGGGAGGVELAFALRNAAGIAAPADVRLVTGQAGLLPEHGASAQKYAARELVRQHIVVDERDAYIADGELFAGTDALEPVDHIIAAIGSAAPSWPAAAGLAVDGEGFIMVDRYQRSVSHPYVLATGDVAVRQDRLVPHSGVHAVRAGQILAANLTAMIDGVAPSRSYTPRRASLYLLSTGNSSAILIYGRFAARGRWVWWLKRWIDTRWVRAYARLAGHCNPIAGHSEYEQGGPIAPSPARSVQGNSR